eukprot:974574-Pyramimonas_sp.AAC.1
MPRHDSVAELNDEAQPLPPCRNSEVLLLAIAEVHLAHTIGKDGRGGSTEKARDDDGRDLVRLQGATPHRFSTCHQTQIESMKRLAFHNILALT